MPTGYTAMIEDRDDVTFAEFALTCARAFGALIEMRDDALDAPIPEKFGPSDYHEKGITEAKAALKAARALTEAKAAKLADAEYARRLGEHDDSIARTRRVVAKYDAMIAHINAWSPPTKDHAGLRDFMLDQIRISSEYERGVLADPEANAPKRRSPSQYIADALASAERDLAYHTKHWQEDCERAAERTAWIKALRESLTPAPSSAGPEGDGGE